MLVDFKLNGFTTFNKEIDLSFIGNKDIKNTDNVFMVNNKRILKSLIIYGPNNTGKTNLIFSLSLLKDMIQKGTILDVFTESDLLYNFFNDEKIIDFEIELISNNTDFKYYLSINEGKISKEILYVDDKLLFNRFGEVIDDEMRNAVELLKNYSDKLIIKTLPMKYKKYVDAINEFFAKMYIVNSFMFDNLVDDIDNLSEEELDKFNKIIKKADISIEKVKLEKNAFKNKKYQLISYYKMNNKSESAPSYVVDSSGTRVFMYYILQIIKCKRNGGILVVDEIDSHLHTLLTKTLISLFNDECNMNMQLLTTSHDLLLLDTKYLFRKDQIYFTYKDKNEVLLYSLNSFKDNKDKGIRNNALKSYLKGYFGALPNPDLYNIFYEE